MRFATGVVWSVTLVHLLALICKRRASHVSRGRSSLLLSSISASSTSQGGPRRVPGQGKSRAYLALRMPSAVVESSCIGSTFRMLVRLGPNSCCTVSTGGRMGYAWTW